MPTSDGCGLGACAPHDRQSDCGSRRRLRFAPPRESLDCPATIISRALLVVRPRCWCRASCVRQRNESCLMFRSATEPEVRVNLSAQPYTWRKRDSNVWSRKGQVLRDLLISFRLKILDCFKLVHTLIWKNRIRANIRHNLNKRIINWFIVWLLQ